MSLYISKNYGHTSQTTYRSNKEQDKPWEVLIELSWARNCEHHGSRNFNKQNMQWAVGGVYSNDLGEARYKENFLRQ